MANLEIAYFTKDRNENVAGREISAETISTLSGSNQQSAVTPPNADLVKINASGGAARVSYKSSNSVAAATTPFIDSGEVLWLPAVPGWKVGAISG